MSNTSLQQEIAVVAERGRDTRRDARSRDIVEQAIGLQYSSSTVVAVEFLKSREIDARIIERVLLDPERRRH